MTDGIASARFVMHGAREVLAIAGPAVHLEQQLDAIESAVYSAPNLAADLARTLVETICKTILTDRGQECEKLGFKELLSQTYASVELVPDNKVSAADANAALRQLAENLDAAILGISLLRQAEGVASHGKDAYFAPLGTIQAEFAARASDALVAFLYKSHRRYGSQTPVRLLQYTDHLDLNEWIDAENQPVAVFGLEYRPSDVLFNVDREAYLDALANFSSGDRASE